jgi:uncharacterized protein YndB with AHSA1/START domain
VTALSPAVGSRDLVVQLHLDASEAPIGATAAARIDAPPERVWAAVTQMWQQSGWVPLVHRIRREGDLIYVDLRFRVTLLSASFKFVVRATVEEGRRLDLRWVEGEPRDIRLTFELEPASDGRTLLRASGGFDVRSLGWLVKYFLKHHPEIQPGIYPGVALVLVDWVRRAAETTPAG